jgi:beta-N-acetylhexosaminidase
VIGCEVIIAATINATQYPGQAALVKQLLERRLPVIAVALRMPYDLLSYPTAPTYLCTYSILDPALKALAAALFGDGAYPGRLPVSIPGMYPIGHGVDVTGLRTVPRTDTPNPG